MDSTNAAATIICNATGHEYERCHRAMRQLAIQIARAGDHAMRFDYFGTGDSAGEYVHASLVQWREDVAEAIDACRRLSGRPRACVVGLRMGANLAAQAVARRDDVDRLVLYAPVADADTLLAEWEREQVDHDRRHGRSAAPGSPEEILGFPLTDAFRAEIRTGLMIPEPGPALRRVLILADSPQEDAVRRVAGVLGSRGADVSIAPADAPSVWRREPLDAIVPFKLLRQIVSWLNEAEG